MRRKNRKSGNSVLVLGIVFFTSLVFAACSNTKYLPAGDALYTGAKVKVEGPKLKKKQKKALAAELTGLTRPKPNSSVLGLRIKLYAYNIAGNPKKKNSPRGWLKNKMGEPRCCSAV